ncbi:hypothetical protein BX600DRAFT_529071 [Xylariales sp. PMI_506]|nr:hypothetical protein BX600DRAFT_529071 [Xylariales sp. PMI_506]
MAAININETEKGDAKVENEAARQAIQALKTYKKATLWSICDDSTSVIMEGYDNHLLGNFIGLPAFRNRYRVYVNETSGHQISSAWQAGLVDIGSIGNIIGALLNGYFTPKVGPRVVMMTSLAALSTFVFITFFAPNMTVILFGQLLCSIPWGIFATTAPAYAVEIAPLALRGYLTAYINLCFCTGQLISARVLKGLVNNSTEWGYRVPFATQWIWPVPLFIGTFLAPESPWYLVRAGKLDEAKIALKRLSATRDNVGHDATIALMVHTDNLEKAEREGVSYWDALKGTNLRRTEIACFVYLAQITSGAPFSYSGTFFYEQTGMSTSTSYAIGLAGSGAAWLSTCISWLYITRWGRRDIFLACIKQSEPIAWAQSVLCLVWLPGYSMSIGPIVFTIVSEIGSTRLRTQTVVLGRSFYYVGNIVAGVLEPYFMSPTAWNAAGKTAFLWAGLAFLTATWAFFRLP